MCCNSWTKAEIIHQWEVFTLTFNSQKIEKRGGAFFAMGTFEMHGVKKLIELPLKLTGEDGNTLGFETLSSTNACPCWLWGAASAVFVTLVLL